MRLLSMESGVFIFTHLKDADLPNIEDDGSMSHHVVRLRDGDDIVEFLSMVSLRITQCLL